MESELKNARQNGSHRITTSKKKQTFRRLAPWQWIQSPIAISSRVVPFRKSKSLHQHNYNEVATFRRHRVPCRSGAARGRTICSARRRRTGCRSTGSPNPGSNDWFCDLFVLVGMPWSLHCHEYQILSFFWKKNEIIVRLNNYRNNRDATFSFYSEIRYGQ